MMKRILLALLLIWTPTTFAMNLQEYLNAVQSKHRSLKALDLSKEAADDNREAGDISLVPVLTMGASYLNDKNPLGQFAALGASETKITSYNLGLGKKFSSGTAVNVYAQTSEVENSGSVPAAFRKLGVGMIGVSLSQSLWKDFFGNATRLRWERQDAATAAAKGAYDLQARGLLVGAEAAYWNYIYARENVASAKGALERAKKIETWTRRRVNDGISDRADLFQAQALVASRQLFLISAQDDLETSKSAIRNFLSLDKTDALPEIVGDISQARPINALIDGNQGRVVLIEAYLASLDAKARAVAAKEVEDGYRPDLVLSGAYNTNAFEKDMPEATANISNTDRPTTKVALNFTYLFDTDVKSAARNESRKLALASRLTAEQKLMDSETSWNELNRQYIEMSKRVESAETIFKLQTDRARATNDLFNKGRTITMSVVDAEQDAATAELNLIRLKSEQRKMEAQGRLYMMVEDK
ncbi:MAG: TolC family protein [Bacillota bacterium]